MTTSLALSDPKRLTLYDVGMEGIIITDILQQNDGELTPELEQRLDELMRQGPNKIEAAIKVMRQIEYDAQTCEAEAKRLKERKESFERQIASLKKRIVFAVDAGFNGKIKSPLFTIWTQKAQDGLNVALADGFTVDMVREDHPELVKTEYSLNTTEARALWQRHRDAIKEARAVLENPDATEESRAAALEMLKAVPECLVFEERIGERYLRVK